MELARLCAQLDSVQSILPPAPPSASAIVPPSGADFVHSTSAGEGLTPSERADLERIARCNPSRRAKVDRRPVEVPDSDTEELFDGQNTIRLPRITNATRLLAFDGSHVLVDAPKPLWLPYMFLRHDCPTLNWKPALENRLRSLRFAPAPPSSKGALRVAINELRQVQFLHYYPQGERVMYTMVGVNGKKERKTIRGLAPIRHLADTPVLRDFVHAQKERIEAEGKGDAPGVIERLGLDLEHDDAAPALNAEEEHAFIFGRVEPQPPRKRARMLSQKEAARILVDMMRGSGGHDGW
jgi:hypothetical protein